MTGRSGDRQNDKRSEVQPHDEFLELCALSTSGDLSPEEQKKLEAHVANCTECREALREFEAAVDVGVPLFSSKLVDPSLESSHLGHECGAVSAGSGDPHAISGSVENVHSPEGNRRVFAFAHGNTGRRTKVNWNYAWLPFAACVLLSVSLATYGYRITRSRNAETVRPTLSSGNSAGSGDARTEALERDMSDAAHQREVLQAQLADRDKMIADLRRQIGEQSASLDQMKATQASLQESVQNGEVEMQRTLEERTSLTQELDTAKSSVQKMQAELASAQLQRSQGQAQDVSLRAQIMDLNSELHQREQESGKQDELLSHDRDIRDLMGARDLYIAEVFDVGRDGSTQKPFGRVFYTKGKSLIFYAYDLDQQSGIKTASTFQAWGRRAGDVRQALNLGVFYQDNTAKKRWVLRFDDPKGLEEINAVFVTVEPNGGSERPSGKPLLFAYLKIEPNHP